MSNTERERRMSMLRAALPYTLGSQRHALEMLLQMDTLLHTARYGSDSDLEACDMESRPEEMLLHIQEFCTPRESDLVQTILNFIKASHLFQNYREFMVNYPTPPPASDMEAAGYPGNIWSNPLNMLFQMFSGAAGNPGHFMEFLVSQLPAEQRQLFEQLKSFAAADMSAQSTDSFPTNQENQEQEGDFNE